VADVMLSAAVISFPAEIEFVVVIFPVVLIAPVLIVGNDNVPVPIISCTVMVPDAFTFDVLTLVALIVIVLINGDVIDVVASIVVVVIPDGKLSIIDASDIGSNPVISNNSTPSDPDIEIASPTKILVISVSKLSGK
jgi:hypothetical protein